MNKYRLLAPGPTPVAAETALAMAAPLLHHRGPAFRAVFARVRDQLRPVFGTRGEVLVLTCSGTGAMEAAVVNLLSAGDTAIVVRGGKFGERFGAMLEAYGCQMVALDVPWGTAVSPDAVARALESNPRARAVFVQATETSTGVLHPVREIAAITRSRADVALVVDGITAVGVLPIPMDEWGIDVLIGGAQKAFMIPPGLAFVSLGAKAWALAERARLPRFYFDLRRERDSQVKGESAWTPAISLVIGLAEALDRLHAEGLENAYARQALLAAATRAALVALGFRLVAEQAPSPALTAAHAPTGVDAAAIVRALRDDHGIVVSGGQGALKGRILRIGHLGYVDGFDVLAVVAALERVLVSLGAQVALGRGLTVAQQVLGAPTTSGHGATP
ncbi:MAG: alanine--glyoxylate aminotransferase family protein [bacterium]